MLKNNTALTIQRFLFLQSIPKADMVDFFQYENQREPLFSIGLWFAWNGKQLRY